MLRWIAWRVAGAVALLNCCLSATQHGLFLTDGCVVDVLLVDEELVDDDELLDELDVVSPVPKLM